MNEMNDESVNFNEVKLRRSPSAACEECDDDGEYLCVGCDAFLCALHYREHLCSMSNFETPDARSANSSGGAA